MNDEQKVAFLIGVLVGIVITVLCSGPSSKEIVCCCGGSGSGPAPAGEVNLDTRGNTGGSGGVVGQSHQPVYGHVTIGAKPTPKPR